MEGFCHGKLGNQMSPSTLPPTAVLEIHFCLTTGKRNFVSCLFCAKIQLIAAGIYYTGTLK